MENYNFDDITPLPITPEGITVSTILYTDEYKYVLGLLRALQANEEYSDRAIFLTEEVIKLNAAHYTVWQYRYHNIINLNKDLSEELDWVEEIALDNVKNYQIWHYRQLLLIKLDEKDPRREFPIIEIMLDDDSKNYHVWSYRKWVVEWSNCWEFENEFSGKFIDEDVYNNSAWCHRYFALFGQPKVLNDQEIENEINYVKNKIELAPQNVSSWNYLIGIYEKLNKNIIDLKEIALKYGNFTENNDKLQSIPALELLVKIYKLHDIELAKRGYDLLSFKYDPIRANYWNYQKSLIQ